MEIRLSQQVVVEMVVQILQDLLLRVELQELIIPVVAVEVDRDLVSSRQLRHGGGR